MISTKNKIRFCNARLHCILFLFYIDVYAKLPHHFKVTVLNTFSFLNEYQIPAKIIKCYSCFKIKRSTCIRHHII